MSILDMSNAIHDYIWHHLGNSGGYVIKMGFTWLQFATAVSVEMQNFNEIKLPRKLRDASRFELSNAAFWGLGVYLDVR